MHSIDWTSVLVAFVAGLPALVSAFAAIRIHSAIKTPSGDPIGHVVERAHETGIANNLLLRKAGGEVKPANGDELRGVGHEPLAVPADTVFEPPNPQEE